MEYTNVKLTEGMSEEELRAIGYKRCTSCNEMRPPELYYKAKVKNGKVYTCRICHRKAVRSYRKVPGSYAYYYRRLEKMRNHARERGLEFTIIVDDYKRIKNEEICYYCKTKTEIMSIDRVDNDRGYVPDNVIGCCWQCNKTKGTFNYTNEEMFIIGQAVRMMKERKAKELAEDPIIT